MVRLGLVLAAIVLAVVFAAQNADVVNLSLLGWNTDASLAVVIVLCFACGALVAALALTPGIYRGRSEHRKLRQRVAELELKTQDHAGSTTSSPSHENIDRGIATPRNETPEVRASW